MAYKIREPRNNIKAQWDLLLPDFITDLTAEEIRSTGGSKRYDQGGYWENDRIYYSIGGYRSRGGMPKKLQTKDETIPISETDAEVLFNAKMIKHAR